MALIHKALICILNHLDLELPIFNLKGTLLSRWAPQRGALRRQELNLDNFIDSNKGNSFAACLVPACNPILRRERWRFWEWQLVASRMTHLRWVVSYIAQIRIRWCEIRCLYPALLNPHPRWSADLKHIGWLGGYPHPTYSKSVYTSLYWV